MSHGRVPGPDAIVLVGFMAAGKSTVGRLLGDRLGWRVVDLDEAVAERTGRTAAQLIRDQGEAALRREERRLTIELAAQENIVLSPGGGWITAPGILEALRPRTALVWLRVSLPEALRRADAQADTVDRPLLGSGEGRNERAAALLREREPYYSRAQVTVDVDGKPAAAVADEILRQLDMDRGDRER